MEPVIITLTTTIEEEVDDFLYGRFYSHTRVSLDPKLYGKPHVQLRQDGDWIPVHDWKKGRRWSRDEIRALALHFIELGKRMKPED